MGSQVSGFKTGKANTSTVKSSNKASNPTRKVTVSPTTNAKGFPGAK